MRAPVHFTGRVTDFTSRALGLAQRLPSNSSPFASFHHFSTRTENTRPYQGLFLTRNYSTRPKGNKFLISMEADDLAEKFEAKASMQGGGGKAKGGRKGGGGGGKPADGGKQREKQISMALSRLLRHQALNAGITLDKEGYAPLDRVVSWPSSVPLSPPPPSLFCHHQANHTQPDPSSNGVPSAAWAPPCRR